MSVYIFSIIDLSQHRILSTMAKQTNTSRAVHAIDFPQALLQLDNTPTGRTEGNPSDLPVYGRGFNYYIKKETLRSRLRHHLVHLIPVLLLLCIFILWWFSHPVNLERKNERNTVVGNEDMTEVVNVTSTHLASLASTTSTPPPLFPYVHILKISRRVERANIRLNPYKQRAQFSEKEDQLRSVDQLRAIQLKKEQTGTSSRSSQRSKLEQHRPDHRSKA
ncbi:hypothetical protein F511_06834 [Dorcoceras hygrometricum]|uniref:Uncharacterized protein n=1 Tax=Dorcoceras hygrometricum TaxID=472368 RepID=A0A2Z7BNF3_9LAMI|nr:hypothetical protein F511_06834 [Dorcoceras hygrometricum]